jgi:hypothetical protein
MANVVFWPVCEMTVIITCSITLAYCCSFRFQFYLGHAAVCRYPSTKTSAANATTNIAHIPLSEGLCAITRMLQQNYLFILFYSIDGEYGWY